MSFDVFLDLEEHLDIKLEEIFLSFREGLMQYPLSLIIIPNRLVVFYFRVSDMIPKFCIE